MMDQAQREAIRKKAEILAGEDLGGDGDALVDMAAQRACAYCQRDHIPEEMEQAVAALVLALRDGDGVKSITGATPPSPMRGKTTPWHSWPPSGGWAG